MYKPANYYAARAAAIRAAVEEDRAKTSATRQHDNPPRIYSFEDLRHSGERISVTLGVFFGDYAGTIVEAILCYRLPGNMYVARYTDDQYRVHFLQVTAYYKNYETYNYAISEVAVI